MKRVKLVVAYDGTNYSGWQLQKNAVTIEQKLNEALYDLLGENIQVIGAETVLVCVDECECCCSKEKKRILDNLFG